METNLEFRKIKSLNFLYEVNENGTIFRNVKSKKQLKIKLDFHHSDKGYYYTFVHIKKQVKRVAIHRVVAECWLGDCPSGYEVDHIDRNSHNNHYSNLRYVSKSQQMKNRDHSKIAKKGIETLKKARLLRMKPVRIVNYSTKEEYFFCSMAECSRWLSEKYNINSEKIRYRLRTKRKRIKNFDIYYLINAETGHTSFTEQGTVHNNSDLTGDYKTAFNKGKQKEVENRFVHTSICVGED